MRCCRQSFLAAAIQGTKTKLFIKTRRGLKSRLARFVKRCFAAPESFSVVNNRINFVDTDILQLRKKYVERFTHVLAGTQGATHCQVSFMQGLFVSYGYLQNPGNGYHLEIRIKGRWLTSAFKKTAAFLKLRFGSFKKDDCVVFYQKSSKRIVKFLNKIGLFERSLQFSDFIATRSILSIVNRQVNSETANINRLITAAEKTIVHIQALLEYQGEEVLTDSLRYAALMRLKYPQDSIEKLGLRFKPKLTKSAVNHRLRRINALYDKLFSKKEPEF